MSNKIVYLWVENYNDVHIDSQINFGSEFIFDLQKEKNKLSLSYIPNESYLPHFFQTNNSRNGIVNVSAFIGENGSGKSLMCSLLRRIISGELRQTDFVLIYQTEEEGKTKHLIYNETEYSFEVTKDHRIDNKIINKAKPFVYQKMHYGGGWHKLKGVQSIFYSPITDFSNDSIIYNKPNDIDVSNNNLIYEDIENEEYSRGQLKPYHFHTIPRAVNFERQLRMLIEFQSFSLPSGLDIHQDSVIVRLVELNVDFSNMERSDFDNIPFQFIELLSELDKIYHKERRALLDSLKSHERYGKDYNLVHQDIFLLEFIRGALKFFIYNLNEDNSHLSHKQIQRPINDKKYEESVREFLDKQEFIESKTLTLLIDNIKSAKEGVHFVEYPNGNSEVVVQLPLTTTQTLFINNEAAMEDFRNSGVSSHNNYVTRFLEFDLGVNLSSGEKAYIDLYSRLYHAKKLLNERIEEKRIEESIDLLVIIIDEGELGFHPQWQKEYLFNLLDIIPFVFTGIGKEVETKNKNQQAFKLNFSNIQLILTSHSPFLLSDLPIRNVNFIERNKETGLSQIKYGEEVGMKETFGANIHELFSESFFIKNGLIGKFAQTKIQKIVDSINKTNQKNQSEIERIKLLINRVGEPFLRNKLMAMFYEKFQKQSRIDELESELKKLKEE